MTMFWRRTTAISAENAQKMLFLLDCKNVDRPKFHCQTALSDNRCARTPTSNQNARTDVLRLTIKLLKNQVSETSGCEALALLIGKLQASFLNP